MKTLHINIRDTLLKNEKTLLNESVRSSSEEISKYLMPDFTEICSTGVVYKYRKGDVLNSSEVSSYSSSVQFSIQDFDLQVLANESVHVTYRLEQYLNDGRTKVTLRSSIWTRIGDSWKMKFHQGTMVSISDGADSWEVIK